tara:strand:+ start:374 stop:664 length:291 start_codon:yes stop_codon:yes gene_type:complete
VISHRRASDVSWTCRCAQRASEVWDWIDKRDIDKHIVSIGIFYGTIRVLDWAMTFAIDHDWMGGLEMAAVIAAVLAPYMALQGAAIKWYFESRPTT